MLRLWIVAIVVFAAALVASGALARRHRRTFRDRDEHPHDPHAR